MRALLASLVALWITASGSTDGVNPSDQWLHSGTVDLKSAGPLAFTPSGVLLVGDSRGSAVFALQVSEPEGAGIAAGDKISIKDVDQKIATRLGAGVRDIAINDMAVHPISHAIYFSVQRGLGADARPAIVRVGAKGDVDLVNLNNLRFAKASLPNPPSVGMKDESGDDVSGYVITDLTIARGNVYVAGLTNDEFASTLRRIPIPFDGSVAATGIRIFHTHHSRFETKSPITALAPYTAVNGREYLVASYACTPLALFDLDSLSNGARVTGRTVAELGAGTHAVDILSYKWNGKRYVAVNTLGRSLQLLEADGLDSAPGLTEQDRPPSHDPISSWYTWGWRALPNAHSGVLRVADFDSTRAVALQRDVSTGELSLRLLAKPILW